MSVPSAIQASFLSRQQGIESLRGRKDPEAIKSAAREMESLFAYEMIKAMRSASNTSAAGGNGLGGEVYGSLFDMELARLMSSKGLGLQEMILKGMGQAAYPVQDKEKASSAEDAAAAPSETLQSGSQKGYVLSPPSAANNASGSKGSANGVPAAVPPVVSAAAEAKPDAPAEKIRPSQPDFFPRAPYASEKTDPILYGEWSPPIREGGRVSSLFGYRKDPFSGAQKFHYGIDIAAEAGTEVYPVNSGEVTFSGYRKGYGNIVEIDHGEGLVTRYAHNRANRVAVGDRVFPDTIIAEVGSTGRSTGPHLHFEVRRDGRKIPPQMVFSGISKGRG